MAALGQSSVTAVVSARGLQVRAFFRVILVSAPPVHLVYVESHSLRAAADAFASEDVAGLDGCLLLPGAPLCPSKVRCVEISAGFVPGGKGLCAGSPGATCVVVPNIVPEGG